MFRFLLTTCLVCLPWIVPGPHDSWTTKSGYVWDGKKWFRPWHGTPQYPSRPLGDGGLWNDGVPYDSPVSRMIQRLEREAAE